MRILRSVRLSVRLMTCFAVVAALFGAAIAVGIVALGAQSSAVDQVRRLMVLSHQVDEQKYYDGDISGWQVAYAWDVYRLKSPQKAVDPASENRAGFLADEGVLKQLLRDTHTADLTGAERAQFQALTALWDSYFAYDTQIADLFAQGQVDKANATILGPSYDVYGKIVTQTTALIDSVSKRAETAASDVRAAARTARLAMIVVGVAALLIAGLLVRAVTASMTGPLGRLNDGLGRLTRKDLSIAVHDRGRDELAAMATAFNEAVGGIRDAVVEIERGAERLTRVSATTAETGGRIARSAGQADDQAASVTATAEEVSGNVHTVAAGAEQMGASISEIARNAADAAQVANTAVTAAENTHTIIGRLGNASAEIEGVVKLITTIANQTNLLALNATIEAARAGDAGKGFAVVANEVKDLAQETSRATESITGRVAAIQQGAGDAVAAIDEIRIIISQISDYQTTIASAVEQQSATTAEMNRNVAEAAAGTSRIASAIGTVASATAASKAGVGDAERGAADLRQLAEELYQLVGRFTVTGKP